jgi:hypothetical protein
VTLASAKENHNHIIIIMSFFKQSNHFHKKEQKKNSHNFLSDMKSQINFRLMLFEKDVISNPGTQNKVCHDHN